MINILKRPAMAGGRILVLAFLLLGAVAQAATVAPDPIHVRKSQLISDLLAQYHYQETQIDDALSANVLRRYFDLLDPERYYFLASDIEEFQDYQHRLDNLIFKGDVQPGFDIFERYKQRVRERADYAAKVLEKGVDLTANDQIDLDRDDSDWEPDAKALDKAWDRRVKHDALTLKLSGDDWDDIKETLQARYNRLLRTVEKYDAEDVFQLYMNAWAQVFDPHTAYMSPRNSENFDIHMRLSLEGIGAQLTSKNDYTEVVELIPGGPASLDGRLKAGDQIIGVGQGEEGPIKDVVGERLSDVVDLIRGKKGTVVRLKVIPNKAAADAATVIDITRDKVKLEEQAASGEIIEVEQNGKPTKVGVIKIPSFYIDFQARDAGDEDYRSTTRDVRKLIDDFKEQGVQGLVVDLRGNGGGSLEEAKTLSSLFVPGGPIVQVRRGDGGVEVLAESTGDLAYEGPLAIMVDHLSASASEIFAAAMQDYGRGIVVGQRTFGKGTVQTLVDLDRYLSRSEDPVGRLKLTIAKFYRINGASTQLIGVEPDIELPTPNLDDSFGESSEKGALPWDSIRPTNYRADNRLGQLLPQLKASHEKRVGDNEAFRILSEEYAMLRALQRDTVLSLNEEERRAKREKAKQQQLALINKRRALYDLEPLASMEDYEPEEGPDTLREVTAAIVAEMAHTKGEDRMAMRWTAE